MIRDLIRRLRGRSEPKFPPVYKCCLAWRTNEQAYYLHRVRWHGEGQA